MLCRPVEALKRVLRALLSGMFPDNTHLEALLTRPPPWQGPEAPLALCVYLSETQVSPCDPRYCDLDPRDPLEDAACTHCEAEDEKAPLWAAVTPEARREGPAMWPTLNKCQRVHLANTNLAMEWTVAGLYLCRFLHRRVSGGGRGGAAMAMSFVLGMKGAGGEARGREQV